MNSWTSIRFALIFCTIFASVQTARILVLFPFPAKSHFVMMEALAKGLAERGHKVTVLSHFPQTTPISNYKDISLKGMTNEIVNNVTLEYIFENWRPLLRCLDFIWREAGVGTCEITYNSQIVREFIRSKEKFDLLITEMWGSDCLLPLANILDVPHISVLTTMELPWSLSRYGGSFNPSYQVHHFLQYPPGRLTFPQRLLNSLVVAYTLLGHFFQSELPSNEIARKYLGSSIPHLTEVVKNSSLLFVNTHFSMLGSRSLPINVVEVGGLHIRPVQPLPPELKEVLDNAKHGVVVFSLGSLIRADTLDSHVFDVFVEEIRRLPQIVLWKFNGTIPNKPENLILIKWLPQRDVLAHPNVKFFITHGGLMGTQEAIVAGVPMLGIPFFSDQRFNLATYQEKGIAIKVEYEDVSAEVIRRAIHELLHNPRYAENAKHYSRLFLDRPQTALETAIYWTEYVIRHKGAKHLQSSASQLSFLEYHLIDVFAFFAVILSLLLYIFCLIYRKLIANLFKTNKPKKD